mmetsp:Transcript_4928/g.6786  ORF Transcript_4928/g.6786 Transcript_4928/m.6786 type:complete len:211 (+) Transcript_4928:788-1420(+)
MLVCRFVDLVWMLSKYYWKQLSERGKIMMLTWRKKRIVMRIEKCPQNRHSTKGRTKAVKVVRRIKKRRKKEASLAVGRILTATTKKKKGTKPAMMLSAMKILPVIRILKIIISTMIVKLLQLTIIKVSTKEIQLHFGMLLVKRHLDCCSVAIVNEFVLLLKWLKIVIFEVEMVITMQTTTRMMTLVMVMILTIPPPTMTQQQQHKLCKRI